MTKYDLVVEVCILYTKCCPLCMLKLVVNNMITSRNMAEYQSVSIDIALAQLVVDKTLGILLHS